MGGRIGRLVQVDDSIPDIIIKGAFERRMASRDRGVVTGADIELVVIFEEEGPFGGVEGRSMRLGLDEVMGGSLLVAKGREGVVGDEAFLLKLDVVFLGCSLLLLFL